MICFGDEAVNHRIARLVFGFSVGLVAAYFAFQWATYPRQASLQRQLEEHAVIEARTQLQAKLDIGSLTVVDPLLPDRKVGKTYVYTTENGWEVSGFYRRDDQDLWHPYLATLGSEFKLAHLKVSDTALLHRDGEGVLEVLP